jgi:Glyoxalase-like domain
VSIKNVQITFDCADPRSLSTFWNATLGYEFPAPPPGFASWDTFSETLPPEQQNSASASEDPAGVGPRLFFQRVPEGKTVKNRVHLDVRAAPGLEGDERMAALEAESERLVALGATRLRRSEPAPPLSGGFIVMQDVEGNEFCLD